MTGFWHRWMVVWCWATIAFGAVFALGALGSLRAPAQLFLDLVFWPIDGQPAELAREAVFATAVCGALMIGWGILMLGLVRDPSLNRNPRVWSLMTTSMVVWFVVDSLASWLSGARLNVLGNTGFLVTYLIPVLASGVLSGTSSSIVADEPSRAVR